MFNDMASAFLTEHPWERGFPWKETMALSRRHVYQEETFAPDGKTVIVSKTRTEATGWVQVNTLLRPDLVRRIESLAQIHTTNRSIVLYTMMYWWAWFKFPPPEIVERRRREREARTEQWRKDMAKATPQAVEQAGADVAAEVIKHVKKGVPSS